MWFLVDSVVHCEQPSKILALTDVSGGSLLSFSARAVGPLFCFNYCFVCPQKLEQGSH